VASDSVNDDAAPVGRGAEPPQAVTIQDVARRANVSPSTVSNVLNGRAQRMRSNTQRRVMEAIDELGYVPNSAARQIKTGKLQTIGLIVPSVANPFWGALARHVESMAMSYGYKVLLCNADRNALRERNYAEMLLGSGVRGVIFGSSPLSFDHIGGLVRRGLLVVALDYRPSASDSILFGSAGVDNAEGARLVARHLISLGHRRFGFLSGPISMASRLERIEGFRSVLLDHGIELPPSRIWQRQLISPTGDIEGAELGRLGAHELLSMPDRPTALFTINDMYALGAYAGARDLGLRVPEDVSIVGFDDIALAAVAYPPLTTVRQPIELLAKQAVTTLISQLEGTESELSPHLVAMPELIVRGSTAPPPNT